MSTELANLKNELMISKLQGEVMELKYKLQKTQAEKSSRLEDSLFSPSLYEHYEKVSVTLSRSGVVPNIYKGKPEDIFVAMAMGYQLGFPVEQSLQDIAVVNGRPCLWGDGLLSLALNHPECQGIDEEPLYDAKGNICGYKCTVTRKGHKPHTKQFTLQDASVAGLLSRGTVWKAYPERMLQMRARSFAIRDKFADALRGLRIAEIEEEDSRIIDAEIIPYEEKESHSQTEKLNAILEANESNPNQEPEVIEAQAEPVSKEELIMRIDVLMLEKEFSDERKEKAIGYVLKQCKVDTLDELTEAQLSGFINQLEKA